nr:DUF5979 domain-containing protein [Tessaracoccus coleopterorum]
MTAQGQGVVASQVVSGAGNSTSVTSQSVIAGTYKLSEAPNNGNTTAGYVQDGAWTCNNNLTVNANGEITLANGTNTTCTVKNKFQTGTLAITKTVTSTPGGGYTQGTAKQFTASYVCTVGGKQVTGTTTVRPNAANGQPGSVATVPNLPAGANCVVTEINAPTGSENLANTSWAWGTPSVSQANVVIPAGPRPPSTSPTR